MRDGVKTREQIKVDKRAVDRGHQRIGKRNRPAGNAAILTRTIDDKDITVPAEPRHFLAQHRRAGGTQHMVLGLRQGDAEPPRRGIAVEQRIGQRPLAAVEINRRHLVPGMGKRDREVKGDGRFTDAALFIGNDDNPRGRARAAMDISNDIIGMFALIPDCPWCCDSADHIGVLHRFCAPLARRRDKPATRAKRGA
jgi:hypothetical protein